MRAPTLIAIGATCALAACTVAAAQGLPTFPKSFSAYLVHQGQTNDFFTETVHWDSASGRSYQETAYTTAPGTAGTSRWFIWDDPNMKYIGNGIFGAAVSAGTNTTGDPPCCFAYLHNPFPPLAWIADTPATPMHGNCAYTSAPMDCYNGTLFVSSGYHAHEWALMCYLKGAAKDAMPTCIDRPGQGDTHMPLTLATADPNPPPPSRFAVDASCSTQCSSTPAFKALNLKTEADAVKVLKTGRV